MEKTFNEKITILMDSQAALLAIQNDVTSSTVLTVTCMKNLNNLGDSDDVTITWTPGHTGTIVMKRRVSWLNQGQHLNVWGWNPLSQSHMLVFAQQ